MSDERLEHVGQSDRIDVELRQLGHWDAATGITDTVADADHPQQDLRGDALTILRQRGEQLVSAHG